MTVFDQKRPWDVLVAGGGNAALCAAISARRQGATVLVVEAAPKFFRGGNTRHTRNLRLSHTFTNRILPAPYRDEEFLDDLFRVTAGRTDETLARLTVSHSPPLWEWLLAQGVLFQPAIGGTLNLSHSNAFFQGGGRAMLNSLYRTADRLAVTIAYDSELVDINIEQGCFESAVVQTAGHRNKVTARSFVAATGGFEANIEWLKQYWGSAAENFYVRGTPFNRGDLLRLLLDRGMTSVGDPTQCHAVAVDSRGPRFDGGIVTRLDCIPFGIVVDGGCRRFYDEGEDMWPKRYAIWGRLIAGVPGQKAFGIFDVSAKTRFMPSLYPPIEAQSIQELGSKLGLNGTALGETVAQFNAAIRLGTFNKDKLDDCRTEGLVPAKSHWATRIETAPFYAYPLSPGITFTYLGLKVDSFARLQTQHGFSPNMFAAGEIMAGNVLGKGYIAGIGMTIGGVFGRIAGQQAATHALN